METIHEGNATPTATDDDVKRMDADTPGHGDARPGASVHEGVGAAPKPTEAGELGDPKSAGTPVHPSPGEEKDDD